MFISVDYISFNERFISHHYVGTACPSGTWGEDCLRDCNCRDSDTACNETTGCAECPDGFTGGDCREDIDECKDNDPCDGHSTCSNTIGTFKCVCHAGYTEYNATVCEGTSVLDRMPRLHSVRSKNQFIISIRVRNINLCICFPYGLF